MIKLKHAILDFVRNIGINLLTITPALVVGAILLTEDSMFVVAIGLIVFVFLTALFIQSVLLIFFRSHRHWVNSLIAMAVMLLTGLLFIDTLIADDSQMQQIYSPSEFALLLNISTEFLGAAVIVVLLQFKRIGVAGAMVLGVVLLHFVDIETGFNLDLMINLASEIFGALLTGWVIHRVIELRDQVNQMKKTVTPKNE